MALVSFSKNTLIKSADLNANFAGLADRTLLENVAFSAYINSTVNMAVASYTKITFDAENYDHGSNFDHSGNNRFDAPYNGIYHFDAQVLWVSGNERAFLTFYVDGVLDLRGTDLTVAAGGNHYASGVSGDFALSAGQYLEVYGWVDDGFDTGTGPVNTRFSGHLVGRT